MTKKAQRKENRRINLEKLSAMGELICLRHREGPFFKRVEPRDIEEKKCYTGCHGNGYCPHLRGYK